MDNPGIVYVLTNEAMPGLVKIGMTADESVEARMEQLYTTGVPVKFECHFAAKVKNAFGLEHKLHNLFAENRVNERREFFRLDPERAVLAIGIGDYEDVTPSESSAPSGSQGSDDAQDARALDAIKARRSRLKLSALDIKPGAILSFSRDNGKTVTVAEDGEKVRFNDNGQPTGEPTSLSAAALKVLNDTGHHMTAANGSVYWMYAGSTLDEIRRKLEDKQYGDDE